MAIAEIYADDVVWHEPDRVVRGRKALASRAVELQAETPGWVSDPPAQYRSLTTSATWVSTSAPPTNRPP